MSKGCAHGLIDLVYINFVMYIPSNMLRDLLCFVLLWLINTLRPRQNGRHFPDDIFKSIFLNGNVWISIKIPMEFFARGPNINIPALVQIMAWRRPGDNPLSEPMTIILLRHICVTRSWLVDQVSFLLWNLDQLVFVSAGSLSLGHSYDCLNASEVKRIGMVKWSCT